MAAVVCSFYVGAHFDTLDQVAEVAGVVAPLLLLVGTVRLGTRAFECRAASGTGALDGAGKYVWSVAATYGMALFGAMSAGRLRGEDLPLAFTVVGPVVATIMLSGVLHACLKATNAMIGRRK